MLSFLVLFRVEWIVEAMGYIQVCIRRILDEEFFKNDLVFKISNMFCISDEI